MTDHPELEIHQDRRGNAVVLAPQGDIDLGHSPTLRAAIHRALDTRPERLAIDLAGVAYMDSSGVATLVEAMQIARRSKVRVVLFAMNPRVRSIFEIARLDTVFTIVPTLDDALGV